MSGTFIANGATFLSAHDMIIAWLRNNPGQQFEPETTEWIGAQLAGRRGAFLDVGASTGWFAVPVAMTGRKVIAVECNARARRRLAENAALNGVNLRVIEAAASDRNGEAIFTHNPHLPLTSGGSLEPGVKPNKASEPVPVVRLDDEIDEPIALIKIDVEGHELAVLDGARRLIDTYRPPMVLEANTEQHLAWLGAWCSRRGYTWRRADTRNMLCEPG